MKKGYIGFWILLFIPILILCAIIFPRSNTKKANAVISSDYSTITYKNKVYVPINLGDLPAEVARDFSVWSGEDAIEATVEKENYFLDKYFFTNQFAVKELDGETFIHINTDYDINESDYYCTMSYKEQVKTK